MKRSAPVTYSPSSSSPRPTITLSLDADDEETTREDRRDDRRKTSSDNGGVRRDKEVSASDTVEKSMIDVRVIGGGGEERRDTHRREAPHQINMNELSASNKQDTARYGKRDCVTR